MKAAYYAVFYQLLRFTFWVRTRHTQQWTALYYFVFLQFLNVASLCAAVAHWRHPHGYRIPVVSALVIFSLLVFLNYRLLRSNPVYQQPRSVYQQQSSAATAWLVVGYAVLSGLVGVYYLKQLHDANLVLRS